MAKRTLEGEKGGPKKCLRQKDESLDSRGVKQQTYPGQAKGDELQKKSKKGNGPYGQRNWGERLGKKVSPGRRGKEVGYMKSWEDVDRERRQVEGGAWRKGMTGGEGGRRRGTG